MQAYHRGIQYPQYLLLTLGRFRKNWWRQEMKGLTCTADQREIVMTSSLAFTENYFIDEVKDADVTTTSGLVRYWFAFSYLQGGKQSFTLNSGRSRT